ncbi:MAG: 3'(2'),5'-bisphosphate nucleotidase CysQ, partial [Alphaproteobacteria bacterium]|nr:3'(2'),5'-bisphosphate nucleotidase CysQ [Alphaproteobacteria bacterium]
MPDTVRLVVEAARDAGRVALGYFGLDVKRWDKSP